MAYKDVEQRVAWRDAIASDDLIERGKLAQAVIDLEFEERSCDRCSVLHQNALRFALGEDVVTESLHVADSLVVREPEGFAFYAVYPELYAMAARQLAPSPRRLVIGVRSIGTTLGAVVAREVGAAGFITLRPVGHPFDRRLAIDDELRAHILSFEDFAIVDEGPGLSGSTFGCIADFLEDAGVPAERIVFFPSHGGMPGSHASQRHRHRWLKARRLVEPFESLLPSILRGAESLIGPIHKMIDVGGGAWRAHVGWNERPPSSLHREARKYLIDGKWLMKFSGLGRLARMKLEKSQRVGLPALGYVNGFLISEWIDGRVAERNRDDLESCVARHLASLDEIDNRMHRWEWIVAHDGRIVKCDALDHAHWHDGIDCDDPAWDVAGAAVELGIGASDEPMRRRYIEAQLSRCEQMLSEEVPEDERMLWLREQSRYLGLLPMRTKRIDLGERGVEVAAETDRAIVNE